MVDQHANYYGVLLVVLVAAVWIGLFTSEPSVTGFVVQENSKFDVEVLENEQRTCADGSLYGECSTLIKPKFCLNGQLEDYPELCGCKDGEVNSNNKCVKKINRNILHNSIFLGIFK